MRTEWVAEAGDQKEGQYCGLDIMALSCSLYPINRIARRGRVALTHRREHDAVNKRISSQHTPLPMRLNQQCRACLVQRRQHSPGSNLVGHLAKETGRLSGPGTPIIAPSHFIHTGPVKVSLPQARLPTTALCAVRAWTHDPHVSHC